MSNPLDYAKFGLSALGGIGDALFGSDQAAQQRRMQEAELAFQRAQLAQQAKQFGLTGAENQREFNAQQALNQLKFGADRENTMFGRQQNSRFAAVRAPIITGLGSGQLLKDNPAWARYAALQTPGLPAAPAPSVRPVPQQPLPPQ